MSNRNLPAPSEAEYSQESTRYSLSNILDSTIAMPNDGETVYPTYGYSEPRNAPGVMGSAVPFVYNQTGMSTEIATPTVGLTPQLRTQPTWFDNQASEHIVMPSFDALGQQNSNRIAAQSCPSNFLDQTVACIRAFNTNSDPNNEQISKLAKVAGLTVTEMTCWFGLIQNIRRCAKTNTSTSLAQVPQSSSESRSIVSSDAGTFIGQSDDSGSSRRFHSPVQLQALPGHSGTDPRSTIDSSPLASQRRRLPSKNLDNTISTSASVSNKRRRLDVSEKLYPCLECEKYYPVDGWYEHLVRVHFPECVWTCGCKENKDIDMQKLWPRWDNFLKHLVERHAFKRSPAADALIKSRSIKVIGCYHHICGFCKSPLPSRQNSLDHIKGHLDDGLQFKNWTHSCASNHDLRSHIAADLNGYTKIHSSVNHEPDNDDDDDDENSGNRYSSYEAHRQQNYGSSNTPANARGVRDSRGNTAGFEGSQPHNHHQHNTITRADCKALETPLSSDLDKAMLPFKSLQVLGQGGYGIVDEVLSSSSNETYARKTVRARQASHITKLNISQLRNELRILKNLNHPHLIKLIGYYTTQTSLYIIMSPVADVNLADYIRQYIPAPSSPRKYFLKWMSCLASAVAYLHDEKIQHRDIKPQNVLVKGQDIFLTDLGNARLPLDPENVPAGKMIITPMYCAPETVSEGFQDCKADIFSLGCVFTEMYSRYFGYSFPDFEDTKMDFDSIPYHSRIMETQRYLMTIEDSHSHALSPELTLVFTTICRMLAMEPAERPEAKSVQSSFPKSSLCCCSHGPSKSRSSTPSDSVGLLPTSKKFDVESLSSYSSKSDMQGHFSKFPTLNGNSSKTVSTLQSVMKPTPAGHNPFEMEHPGTAKTSPLKSTSTHLFAKKSQVRVDTSQHSPEQHLQPKMCEEGPSAGNVTLHSLAQRRKQSAKPKLCNVQAKNTLSSPAPIGITESSFGVTKGARNVTRAIGLRNGSLTAKTRGIDKTRKIGACARCRIKKIHCSLGEPCIGCMRVHSPDTSQWSGCLRGPLNLYIEDFCPAFLVEYLDQAALKYWIDAGWKVDVGSAVLVQVSSGQFFKPMTLKVREIRASSQDSLSLPDLTSWNNQGQKFALIPALLYALHESEVDQSKQKCLDYINAAINCPLDDPKTLIGDTPKIVWKSLEYIQRWKNSAAKENDLIQAALKVYWIQYAMSRTFTFYNQSASIAVAGIQSYSTVLPSIRVLDRQLKRTLNILFHEHIGDLLRYLEHGYKSKSRKSWVLCFCANLILCLVVELLQNAIDEMALYKISEKKEDPEDVIGYSSSTCKRLEELPIKYSWTMFFGLYKSYNPIKNGYPPDDNVGQDEGQAELIDAFAQMIHDYKDDILDKAAEPCLGGTSRIIEQHKSFRERNQGRLVSKILKLLY